MEIKNIRTIHDKDYIYELIAEGEHEMQDFKFAISDSRKIARSIAAFANKAGGRLLIGVKDNGNIAGIRTEEEFYMIEQAAEMYCKPAQKVESSVYSIEGRIVMKVDILKSKVPVYAQDENHHWQAYIRVNDENIQVPRLLDLVWKRRQDDNSRIVYSDFEMRVLKALRQTNNPEELFKLDHILVELCSAGIITFVYDNEQWTVQMADQ